MPLSCALIGAIIALPFAILLIAIGIPLQPAKSFQDSLAVKMAFGGILVGLLMAAFRIISQLGLVSDQKARFQAAQTEHDHKAEQARKAYISAYNAYFPKWRAWQKSMEAYNKQRDARRAWEDMLTENERRAKQAATALDRLYHTIDTRARVQLGLTSQTDILSIYYEAVSAASSTHLDFGLLRLPRWRGLVTLAPLDEVFSALPRVPNDILEEVAAPVFPLRPTPPKILVFASDFDIPLPVEQVRFS